MARERISYLETLSERDNMLKIDIRNRTENTRHNEAKETTINDFLECQKYILKQVTIFQNALNNRNFTKKYVNI